MKNKCLKLAVYTILCISVCYLLYMVIQPVSEKDISINIIGEAKYDVEDYIQLFWSNNTEFSEDKSQLFSVIENNRICFDTAIPADTKFIRIDFGEISGTAELIGLKLQIGNSVVNWNIAEADINSTNQINKIEFQEESTFIKKEAKDPYIVVSFMNNNISEYIYKETKEQNKRYKYVSCIAFAFFGLFFYLFRRIIEDRLTVFWKNRKLIFDLGVNDFKTRFAGAAFGTVWAFIQPIVTILVYWFVFQVGFRNGNSGDTGVPYALWLSTGLIPWFFFSEAWSSATNSLIEYSYLVKKVVFNISIIPCVKIISALFVHGFFVLLLVVMYLANGLKFSICWIQLIYYSFCMIALTVALSYITSALQLFMRDMAQIIAVILQIGVWMTPIMWNIDMMPERLHIIFKANPMYYVVNGYRQSLIKHEYIWNDTYMNIYFWAVTITLFVVSQRVFEKLKPHFADVL